MLYEGYEIEKYTPKCSLDRAFPIRINKDGKIIQYARTFEQAQGWVDRELEKKRGKVDR